MGEGIGVRLGETERMKGSCFIYLFICICFAFYFSILLNRYRNTNMHIRMCVNKQGNMCVHMSTGIV